MMKADQVLSAFTENAYKNQGTDMRIFPKDEKSSALEWTAHCHASGNGINLLRRAGGWLKTVNRDIDGFEVSPVNKTPAISVCAQPMIRRRIVFLSAVEAAMKVSNKRTTLS